MHSSDGFLAKTFEKKPISFSRNRVWLAGSDQFLVSTTYSSHDSSHLQTLIFKLPSVGTSPEGPSSGVQRAILKVYARKESYSAPKAAWPRESEIYGLGNAIFGNAFSAGHFQ